MNELRALIIDDEESICKSLSGVIADEGWHVDYAFTGKDGFKKLSKNRPHLILLDVWMQGWDGIETLQRIKDFDPAIPVVIMSGHATIDTAVRATRLGAMDFLEKPLSIEKLIPILTRAQEHQAGTQDSIGVDLIGESDYIKELRNQILLVAPKFSSVLITGENGTGKEVISRLLHQHSNRAKLPFVAVNCAAIPEELIETELFGHEKGAFTHAVSRKIGRFEMAHQGTLFLDEIGDMSLRTQAKVLRVIQDRVFERVGGQESIHVDVRLIAATNKNLETEMKQGRFREDLFYRLNVVPIHLRPLRERGDDILPLVEAFLTEFAGSLGEQKRTLSKDVENAFKDYSWPGNIRELRNVLERLCILAKADSICLTDLPDYMLAAKAVVSFDVSEDTATLREAKSEFERIFILSKLEEYGWNVSRTSEAIGIERSHLHRKLKSYDIDPKKLKHE
jgi:two-component system, NtrC family, nitrogen regulation response regulator NtrX